MWNIRTDLEGDCLLSLIIVPEEKSVGVSSPYPKDLSILFFIFRVAVTTSV